MAAYRSGEVPAEPVMAGRIDAAAYAAYRMPATAAATAMALRQMRLSLAGWAPNSLVDVGAGTGGAAWAAVAELPGLTSVTLLEQSAEAIKLGQAIFSTSTSSVLLDAAWLPWRLTGDGKPRPADMPAADLVTGAYVLGELMVAQQASLVDLAAASAPAVLLVEPGTPAGHRRILAARERLLAAGYLLAAPCPHQHRCPLDIDGDWCHFAARLHRSALHRQVKAADLAYEDEKFSYIAMIRPDLAVPELPSGRVVRRPQQRKGLVTLDLCAGDGSSRRVLVSKSKGEAYREARKAAWGDRWDPMAS